MKKIILVLFGVVLFMSGFSQVSRATIKPNYQTGKIPTQAQFYEWIDSDYNLVDDSSDDVTEGGVNLFNRLPDAGTAGQILQKLSGVNYDADWVDDSGNWNRDSTYQYFIDSMLVKISCIDVNCDSAYLVFVISGVEDSIKIGGIAGAWKSSGGVTSMITPSDRLDLGSGGINQTAYTEWNLNEKGLEIIWDQNQYTRFSFYNEQIEILSSKDDGTNNFADFIVNGDNGGEGQIFGEVTAPGPGAQNYTVELDYRPTYFKLTQTGIDNRSIIFIDSTQFAIRFGAGAPSDYFLFTPDSGWAKEVIRYDDGISISNDRDLITKAYGDANYSGGGLAGNMTGDIFTNGNNCYIEDGDTVFFNDLKDFYIFDNNIIAWGETCCGALNIKVMSGSTYRSGLQITDESTAIRGNNNVTITSNGTANVRFVGTTISASTPDLIIDDSLSVTGDLDVSNDLSISGSLNVDDTSHFEGAISIAWDSIGHSSTQNLDFADQDYKYVGLVTGIETINISGLPSGESLLCIEQNGTGYAITKGTGWGTLIGSGTISSSADAVTFVQFERVLLPGGSGFVRHFIVSD